MDRNLIIVQDFLLEPKVYSYYNSFLNLQVPKTPNFNSYQVSCQGEGVRK